MQVATKLVRHYQGEFVTEEEAGRYYDFIAINIFGIDAKTNFCYTKRQIEDVLAPLDQDFNSA